VRRRGRGRGLAQLLDGRLVVTEAQLDHRVGERRVQDVDDTAPDLASEQAPLFEAGVGVGRGQRGDGAAPHAGGQAPEGPHRDAGRRRNLLERRGRAFPQRLVGRRLR